MLERWGIGYRMGDPFRCVHVALGYSRDSALYEKFSCHLLIVRLRLRTAGAGQDIKDAGDIREDWVSKDWRLLTGKVTVGASKATGGVYMGRSGNWFRNRRWC